MDFYPFFLDCIIHHRDNKWKKRELELLAFGKGLIIKREDGRDVLLTPDGGEFLIPKKYSDEDRIVLEEKLWGFEQESEFFLMQQQLENTREVWATAKKKDRLRMIDNFIISTSSSVMVRNVLVFALILKLLQVKLSVNYEVIELAEDYTPESFVDMMFEYQIPSSGKTRLSTLWSKKSKTPSTLAGLAISLCI